MIGTTAKSGTTVQTSVTRRNPCRAVSSSLKRRVRSVSAAPAAKVSMAASRNAPSAPSCCVTLTIQGMSMMSP